MMKIHKFIYQTWQEIPEKDNPAMVQYDRNEKCLMIFKGKYPLITNGGFVVAIVPEQGDITKLGVFWTEETADFFASATAHHYE